MDTGLWGMYFVFLFFGLMGVIGSSYLYIHTVSLSILLPAICIGALSTAVLHLNNMRDTENDIASNKRTVANIIGIQKSKYYFVFLLITAMSSLIAYNYMRNTASLYSYAFVLIYPLFFILIKKVMGAQGICTVRCLFKAAGIGHFLDFLFYCNWFTMAIIRATISHRKMEFIPSSGHFARRIER